MLEIYEVVAKIYYRRYLASGSKAMHEKYIKYRNLCQTYN